MENLWCEATNEKHCYECTAVALALYLRRVEGGLALENEDGEDKSLLKAAAMAEPTIPPPTITTS